MDVLQELRSAEGMLRRRKKIIDAIGSEDSKADAWNAFQSMLMCLKEVRKHHGRIVQWLDDDTAGYAVESFALLSECELLVDRAEASVKAWGFTESECAELRGVVSYA